MSFFCKNVCLYICPQTFLGIIRPLRPYLLITLSVCFLPIRLHTGLKLVSNGQCPVEYRGDYSNFCKSVSLSLCLSVCLSFLGSGPKGVDDLCFHIYWGFSPPSHPPLKSQSRGPNPSLEAQTPVSRPKTQPQGLNPSLMGQILPFGCFA